MAHSPTRAHGRKHVMAFRLSKAEYQTLALAARYEKRKMADLVYIIVAEALDGYAKRLGTSSNPPSEG